MEAWQVFALENRPLHNTPLPTLSPAPFGESGKRPEKMAAAESESTLDLLPEDLSLSRFGEGRVTQRSERSFKTGPCVDNITGLQLVLSCPPWSDGKGDSLHSRP